MLKLVLGKGGAGPSDHVSVAGAPDTAERPASPVMSSEWRAGEEGSARNGDGNGR